MVVAPAQGLLFALEQLLEEEGPAEVARLAAELLVIPALVTAMHVAAVVDLGEGRRPSMRRSLGVAARAGLPATLVVAMYSVGVLVGVLLLVAPGVFLSVHWYFGAQAAVAEGRRGRGALRRSGELVGWRWGPVFGSLIVLGFLTAVLAGAVGLVLDAALGDADAAQLAELIAAHAVAVSFTSLVATLLFFDLRARSGRQSGQDG